MKDNQVLEALSLEGLEDEDIEEGDNVVTRFMRRPVLTVCITVGLIIYGITNIVFDWLWVDDMLRAEKGLVFGPPGTQITGTLIWIASIGTISFIFEIVNMVWKVTKGQVFVNEDINSLLSLFLEEVPSVTLNWLLAACREVPLSYYQMVKAALAMVGAALRCLRCIIKFLTVRRREGTKKGFIPLILRIMIMAACAYLLAGSIMTWTYTYSPSDDEDASGIKLPPTLVTKSYDSARYFYKAGFYLSHPWFNDCNDNIQSWNENSVSWNENSKSLNNGSNTNWMKIESLVDFENAGEMSAEYHYNAVESVLVTHQDDITVCFKAFRENCSIIKPANCSSRPQEPYESLEFHFESKEYTKTLVFGDIIFGAIHTQTNPQSCDPLTVDSQGFLSAENDTNIAQLQYFKSRAHVNDTELFLYNGTYRYYMYPADLFNVTEVWKTGHDKCEMTGSIAPNHGDKIQMPC